MREFAIVESDGDLVRTLSDKEWEEHVSDFGVPDEGATWEVNPQDCVLEIEFHAVL